MPRHHGRWWNNCREARRRADVACELFEEADASWDASAFLTPGRLNESKVQKQKRPILSNDEAFYLAE